MRLHNQSQRLFKILMKYGNCRLIKDNGHTNLDRHSLCMHVLTFNSLLVFPLLGTLRPQVSLWHSNLRQCQFKPKVDPKKFGLKKKKSTQKHNPIVFLCYLKLKNRREKLLRSCVSAHRNKHEGHFRWM